jgi:hypothetical protein
MLWAIGTVFTSGIITLGFGPLVGFLVVVGIVLFRVFDISRILIGNHFRNNSMVYSVSRMWATGFSHPAVIAVTKILLYSAGQLLLISNPARDTI